MGRATDRKLSNNHAFLFWMLLVASVEQTVAGLLEDGEDFSNNLASDLAPLLALFGERVTMQFMSQSTGWADCIMLAMAPLGIITIIVSAIRVGGYRWLKAIVGRARENIVLAELEVMSSTSHETCELWNGKTIVRCPGAADICEFICVYPDNANRIESARIMDIKYAVSKGVLQRQGHDSDNTLAHLRLSKVFGGIQSATKILYTAHLPGRRRSTGLQQRVDIESGHSTSSQPRNSTLFRRMLRRKRSENAVSEATANESVRPQNDTSALQRRNEIIIIRDQIHPAPNISLNCRSANTIWQLWAFAAFGILLQLGVLAYFGVATEYDKLKYENDGEPVDRYAMPLAVTGTVLLVAGMLVCSHVVDSGSKETVYKLSNVGHPSSSDMAVVWLQKQTTVNERHYHSAALYLDAKRELYVISERANTVDDTGSDHTPTEDPGSIYGSEQTSSKGNNESQEVNSGRLQVLTVVATFISLLGIGGQFTGLRGMHWTASVAQLAAVVVMTFLRAVARRHLAPSIRHKRLTPNYELEWFVLSLANLQGEIQDPVLNNPTSRLVGGLEKQSKQDLRWTLQTEASKIYVSKKFEKRRPPHLNVILQERLFTGTSSHTVSNLDTAQGTLDLRRHLGELGNWRSPVLDEALALSGAIELTMSYFCSQFPDQFGGGTFKWSLGVLDDKKAPSEPERISFLVQVIMGYCRVRVDELDAALSLWLLSAEHKSHEGLHERSTSRFDTWAGDKKVQHPCLQILGPQTEGLVRNLKWWMPAGGDGIMTAKLEAWQMTPEDDRGLLHEFRQEDIGRSGQRWPNFSMDETIMQFIHTANPARNPRIPKARRSSDVQHWSLNPNIESTSQHPEEKTRLPLVMESRQPLEKLYAMDLFSSFIWALSRHLKRSSVSKRLKAKIKVAQAAPLDGPLSLTLESDELSALVRRIVSQTAWSEDEVYSRLIPPLSASDNLPRLDAVINLVLRNAVSHEKSRDWDAAYNAYSRLFEIAKMSDRGTYTYWRITAVFMRFDARLRRTDSQRFRQNHDEYESSSLLRIRILVRNALEELDDDEATLQRKLDEVFQVSETVISGRYSRYPLDHSDVDWLRLPQSYYSSGEAMFEERDIFDRTALHHAMRSIHEGDEESFYRIEGARDKYADRISLCISEIEEICNVQSNEIDWPKVCSFALAEPGLTTQRLLGTGIDPNAQDLDHWTPLHHACDIIQPIQESYMELRQGSRGVFQFNRHSRQGVDTDQTSLSVAAEAKANFLVTQKANINAQGLDGITPLHCAVLSNCPGLVEWLARNRADPMIADIDGQNPLHFAAKNNTPNLFRELINSGVQIESKDIAGRTSLHLAAMFGATQSVEELVRRGSKTSAPDNRGRTPLHMASLYNSSDGIKAILNNRMQMGPFAPIDTTARDEDGRTPLHLAAMFNSREAIEQLLGMGHDAEHGCVAEVSAKDRQGDLALHLAVKSNASEAAQILLENMKGLAADDQAPENQDLKTPFDCAVDIDFNKDGNSVEIVKRMIDLRFGLGPDLRDLLIKRRGTTAFYRAIKMGQFSSAIVICKAVVHSGLNIEALRASDPSTDYSKGDLMLSRATCAFWDGPQAESHAKDEEFDETPVENSGALISKILDIVENFEGRVHNRFHRNDIFTPDDTSKAKGRQLARMLDEGVERFQKDS